MPARGLWPTSLVVIVLVVSFIAEAMVDTPVLHECTWPWTVRTSFEGDS